MFDFVGFYCMSNIVGYSMTNLVLQTTIHIYVYIYIYVKKTFFFLLLVQRKKKVNVSK